MTSYSMQPSVEGFNGGEQRRKRIFSGNFTEIIKCLVLEYLRRPLKTMKGPGTSANRHSLRAIINFTDFCQKLKFGLWAPQ